MIKAPSNGTAARSWDLEWSATSRGAMQLEGAQLALHWAVDDFVFTYPDSWETIDPSELRQYPGGELLFAASPSDDGTSVNWIRMTAEYTANVEEVAQQDWAAFDESNPGVIVESLEITEAGGQPAVRRVFSMPYEDIPGGRAYIVQVYIVNDQRLYALTGLAPSADALRQHLAEIQGILASVQFTH